MRELVALDLPGGPGFVDALRAEAWAPAELIEVEAHINDADFTEAALTVFDRWAAAGRIARPA